MCLREGQKILTFNDLLQGQRAKERSENVVFCGFLKFLQLKILWEQPVLKSHGQEQANIQMGMEYNQSKESRIFYKTCV